MQHDYTSFINIVFDGPPGPVSGRFVEVEDNNGHSIKSGEWVERPDGLWALRIPYAPYEEPNRKIVSCFCGAESRPAHRADGSWSWHDSWSCGRDGCFCY